jgi:hypothetical protein
MPDASTWGPDQQATQRIAELEGENARRRAELEAVTAQRNDYRRSLVWYVFGEPKPFTEEEARAIIEECERTGVSSEELFRELDEHIARLEREEAAQNPLPTAKAG